MTRSPRDMPGFSQKVTTPSPMDRPGEPERDVGDGEPPVYGEPKGPRPPRFEKRPREVIDERARSCPPDPPPLARPTGPERNRRGFHSGLTGPEAFATTGDQPPARLRPRDARDDPEPQDPPGDLRPEISDER